jgi:hypothetical protein
MSKPKRVRRLPSPKRVRTTPLSERIRRASLEGWSYIPGDWAAEVAALERAATKNLEIPLAIEAIKALPQLTDQVGLVPKFYIERSEVLKILNVREPTA